MSLKKISLATVILLGLTACGSSNHNKGTDNNAEKPTPNAIKAEQNLTPAENTTALKEVEKKLAYAETQLEKAKQDLAAKEGEMTQLTEKKLNAEKDLNSAKADLVKAQQDLATQKSELAKLNADKLQAEADLTSAKNKLAEAQQNLNDVKQSQNSTASELQAAQNKLKVAEQAKEEAENKLAGKQRVIDAIHEQIQQLDSQYNNVGWVDPDALSYGFHKKPYILLTPATDDAILTADQYVYKQAYSTIQSKVVKTSSLDDDVYDGRFRIDRIWGDSASTVLPNEGSATYIGEAFNGDNRGSLTYQVNFAERTGSGKLSNFRQIDDITLEKGNIDTFKMRLNNVNNSVNLGIKADASMADGTKGKYELGFFGPNAEEIAGEAYLFKHLDGAYKTNGRTANAFGDTNRGTQFGFGGERGAIQP